MSPKTGCGNIRAQPDGIFGGHSGGQLEPRAPVNIALWPWPATCGDTSVPLPDPLSPPLPSVPLAEAQGSLLSALPSFGSSLVFPGSSDGKESACNTGDPGSIWGACGLQSMGSQRVRHHWATNSRWGILPTRAEGFNAPSHGLKITRPNFTLGIGRSRILAAQNQLKEKIQIWNFTSFY